MGKKPVLCSNKHHAERAQPGAASYFISPQPIRVMPTRAGFSLAVRSGRTGECVLLAQGALVRSRAPHSCASGK